MKIKIALITLMTSFTVIAMQNRKRDLEYKISLFAQTTSSFFDINEPPAKKQKREIQPISTHINHSIQDLMHAADNDYYLQMK